MVIHKEVQGTILTKGLLDIYIPPTGQSYRWKHWEAVLDLKTCKDCVDNHGQIYEISVKVNPEPPIHFACRCVIEAMKSVVAGKGTKDGINGADWQIKFNGNLPGYYITERELAALGWKHGKAPVKYAPGKMATMGIYQNRNGHLPDAPGRIWYEADINYYSGRRNSHRILWSNDGLIFVTYDHYTTFMEIV